MSRVLDVLCGLGVLPAIIVAGQHVDMSIDPVVGPILMVMLMRELRHARERNERGGCKYPAANGQPPPLRVSD